MKTPSSASFPPEPDSRNDRAPVRARCTGDSRTRDASRTFLRRRAGGRTARRSGPAVETIARSAGAAACAVARSAGSGRRVPEPIEPLREPELPPFAQDLNPRTRERGPKGRLAALAGPRSGLAAVSRRPSRSGPGRLPRLPLRLQATLPTALAAPRPTGIGMSSAIVCPSRSGLLSPIAAAVPSPRSFLVNAAGLTTGPANPATCPAANDSAPADAGFGARCRRRLTDGPTDRSTPTEPDIESPRVSGGRRRVSRERRRLEGRCQGG